MTTTTMTLTEALSEVNLIKKKIEAKKPLITTHAVRVDHTPDPYEKEGGASIMIRETWQSLTDLNRRLEVVRGAVAKANLETTIKVGDTEKTIHDWLIWKRETHDWLAKYTAQVISTVKMNQDTFNRQPQVMKENDGTQRIVKLLVNVDVPFFQRQLEELVTIEEKLDGQLSLKNATTTVTI